MTEIFGAPGYSLDEVVMRGTNRRGLPTENRLWFVTKDGERIGEGRQNFTAALEYARRLHRDANGIKQSAQPLNVSFFPNT